jgi:hypothetical protein
MKGQSVRDGSERHPEVSASKELIKHNVLFGGKQADSGGVTSHLEPRRRFVLYIATADNNLSAESLCASKLIWNIAA